MRRGRGYYKKTYGKAGGGRAFSCGRHPDEPHRHSVGIKAVPVRRLRRNRTYQRP